MKKILVGLDNSDPSWRAFDLALELAKSLDLGKVGAIHVGKSTEPLDKAEEMARGEGIEIERIARITGLSVERIKEIRKDISE